MRRSAWWREMSGPAKFRLYTRVSLHGAVVVTVVVTAATGGPRAVLGVVIAGLATIVALEAQAEIAAWPSPALRRWALPGSAVVLAAVWVTYAFIGIAADSDTVADEARVAGVCAAMLAALSIMAFTRFRWWLVVAVSLATGFVFGAPTGTRLGITALTLTLGVFVIATTMVTLWGMRIVDDLERARNLEKDLQLAEERLRFARDLHDVVGRSFSVIAVKSELAATLSRAGVADRASAEMDEVKALAVESMEEMRTLVRGYRDIDLDGEIAGARSLLSATGCRLVVEGGVAGVPPQLHEVAAWVVREGTTNIVKHSSASSATLALGAVGMSLRNDGATGEPGERSGLLGLAERLAAHGASLGTTATDAEFVLEIKWETP